MAPEDRSFRQALGAGGLYVVLGQAVDGRRAHVAGEKGIGHQRQGDHRKDDADGMAQHAPHSRLLGCLRREDLDLYR